MMLSTPWRTFSHLVCAGLCQKAVARKLVMHTFQEIIRNEELPRDALVWRMEVL